MSSRCVTLVPVGSSIDPRCAAARAALERRGYAVRQVLGFSAIDFGRSSMASVALADGFDELLWIDSDIVFHPDDVETLPASFRAARVSERCFHRSLTLAALTQTAAAITVGTRARGRAARAACL